MSQIYTEVSVTDIKMLDGIDTQKAGKSFSLFSSLGSTNSYARENISLLNDGHLIVSDEQLGGRGRQGKNFYSPEGGLYMSLVIKDEKAAGDELFTVKASLAICRAIDRLCGVTESNGVGIKWVNDICFAGKKLCGILCERLTDDNGKSCVIAGFGINFKLDYSTIPSDIRKTATSLFDITKKSFSKLTLCKYICREIEDIIYNGTFDNEEVLRQYKRRSVVIGKEISILAGDEAPVRAAALDICPDGSLLVRTQDGFTRKLCGGEITVRLKK